MTTLIESVSEGFPSYSCSLDVKLLKSANSSCNDIVLPHSNPLDGMPYSMKGIVEFNEDMIQALLMLEVLFIHNSKVQDILYGVYPGCEPKSSSAINPYALGLSLT